MLDKATVLTTIFTIVDDVMKGSRVIQEILDRPGPTARLSDSEVVTLAPLSGTHWRTTRRPFVPAAPRAVAQLFSRTQRA